jgi:hypothetical protein
VPSCTVQERLLHKHLNSILLTYIHTMFLPYVYVFLTVETNTNFAYKALTLHMIKMLCVVMTNSLALCPHQCCKQTNFLFLNLRSSVLQPPFLTQILKYINMINTNQSCFIVRSPNTSLYLVVYSSKRLFYKRHTHTHTHTHIHAYILPIL